MSRNGVARAQAVAPNLDLTIDYRVVARDIRAARWPIPERDASACDAEPVSSALDEIAATAVRLTPTARALIGIDGEDGSGKTMFARNLARQAARSGRPTVIVHLDDFLNPSAVRHARGRSSPDGFWLDTYNYDAFRSGVLAPLMPGGNGRYRARSYDPRVDRTVLSSPMPSPQDALIIVEGMFLHRDGLAQVWDLSVFLDVPFTETVRRMAERDGSSADPTDRSLNRYIAGQQIYFSHAKPWDRATVVVDNTDFEQPRIIDASAAQAARS